MKRITALPLALLAAAISFGASACGDDGPTASVESSTPSSTATETTEPAPSTEPGTTTEDTGTTAPGTSVPQEEPTVESAADVVVGLSANDATAAAEELGWTLRVTRQDGEDLPATMDLRPDRVNVEITGGVVTAVLNIG